MKESAIGNLLSGLPEVKLLRCGLAVEKQERAGLFHIAQAERNQMPDLADALSTPRGQDGVGKFWPNTGDLQ